MGDIMANEIGKRIRELRLKKGLTQKELGALCGIAEPNIGKYELGKQNPKYGTLFKIADALNVPYDYLLFGEENPYKEANLEEMLWSIVDELEDKASELVDTTYSEDIIKTIENLLIYFLRLNNEGRKKLFERIEELTEMEKYTKK